MTTGATHKSLRRSLAILRVFSEHEPALGVGEIARRLDVHKSTVSRTLSTLLDEGIVWHNPDTGKYSLGMGLVELAGIALGQIDVRAAAMRHMEELRQQVDESVSVAVLRGREAVTVAHIPSTQSVRHVVWIGRRIPLPTTASGKVFLAAMRDAGQDWAELTDQGSPAPASWSQDLSLELDLVSEQGYAVELDELDGGTSAVAAPIADASGAVVATLCLGAPAFRFGPDEIASASKLVVDSARAIAADLGMRAPHAQGGERAG